MNRLNIHMAYFKLSNLFICILLYLDPYTYYFHLTCAFIFILVYKKIYLVFLTLFTFSFIFSHLHYLHKVFSTCNNVPPPLLLLAFISLQIRSSTIHFNLSLFFFLSLLVHLFFQKKTLFSCSHSLFHFSYSVYCDDYYSPTFTIFLSFILYN